MISLPFRLAKGSPRSYFGRASTRRRLSSAGDAPLRVCVVGSGPAGFYATKYILKDELLGSVAAVDMLERLPSPFGLVRAGVAPDHPEVKAVQNDFAQVAADPRFAFWGNVRVGADVSLEDLRRLYHVVVLAYGAESDQTLGLPGEDLEGVFTARAFVNWYNGHPDFAWLTGPVTAALAASGGTAVVVGVGNVALDCARVLLKGAAGLRNTDIAEHALSAFEAAGRPRGMDRVVVMGRRGHVQAAFTIKELRELTRLGGSSNSGGNSGNGNSGSGSSSGSDNGDSEAAACVVREEELALGETLASLVELAEQRPRQRINTLLHQVAAASRDIDTSMRRVELRFLLSPVEIVPAAGAAAAAAADASSDGDGGGGNGGSGNSDSLSSGGGDGPAGAAAATGGSPKRGRVGAMVAERMRLEGEAGAQRAVPTGEREMLPCGLLLESIGYRSLPLPNVPFDERRAVVLNDRGRVVGLPGVYCSGWVRRGPSGIIGANIADARAVVAAIAEDYNAGKIPGLAEARKGSGGGNGGLRSALAAAVAPPNAPPTVVSWDGHCRIDEEEARRGRERGKPREKFTSVAEMLAVASGNEERTSDKTEGATERDQE